jgi:hypothetical protein
MLGRAGTPEPLAPGAPSRRALSEALLSPQMRDLLRDERRETGRVLRLRLAIPGDAAHAGLRAVPWELCHLGEWEEPQGFTGLPVELTRHPGVHLVREVGTDGGPVRDRPTLSGRMMIAAAYGVGGVIGGHAFEPLDPGAFSDVDAVRRELDQTALPPEVIQPGDRRRGVSAYELRQALAAGGVCGFYFAGHHGPGGLVLAGPGNEGDTQPEWLSAPDLAGLLLACGAEVVVLMACHTAAALDAGSLADRADSHRAYAEELAAAGLPWIVSAQGEITSGASQRFAPAFFRHLAYGATVDEAAYQGCLAMGDHAGLIVVHTSGARMDPVVRRPQAQVRPGLTYRVTPSRGHGRQARQPPARNPDLPVNPDVRWGLNRGLTGDPVRGILADGENGPDLVARLDRTEEIIRQGAFDFNNAQTLRRRGWFGIDGSAHPPVRAGDLSGMVRYRRGLRWYLDADADGAGLGFVVTWAPAGGEDGGAIAELLAGIWHLRPAAATIIQVSGAAEADLRAAAALARRLPGTPDVLAWPAPPGDIDARLDGLVESGAWHATAQGPGGDETDARALAALRHRGTLGWRKVWPWVEMGASEAVKAVAAYLSQSSEPASSALESGSSALAFCCESDPAVVAAAWRAGLRPDFVPARLPSGAPRMAGCWALLARSRLTPEVVCWLYERGSPLASIPGLLPAGDPDHGYEAWLAQLRAAYWPAPPG